MIRVLLVDDDALVRSGLRIMLAGADSLDVVGEAADGREVLGAVDRHRPDVVLMDIRMPQLDGIEATRRVIALDGTPPARVLMLTTFDLNEYVYEALRAGASGFLLKDVPPEQLAAGIRVVAGGEALLSPGLTRRLIARLAEASATPRVNADVLDQLTTREKEIVGLVAHGLSNTEIAAALTISHATAKTHVSRAMAKLGARDRAQLVAMAYRHRLVEPPGA